MGTDQLKSEYAPGETEARGPVSVKKGNGATGASGQTAVLCLTSNLGQRATKDYTFEAWGLIDAVSLRMVFVPLSSLKKLWIWNAHSYLLLI